MKSYQGGACGAAGPASAPGSAFPEARPSHAGPHRARHADQGGSPARRPVWHRAVFLVARLSRSRPPRLGRSLRSRRMRSASPNLDPASTHQESAPIEEDGAEQDPAEQGAAHPRRQGDDGGSTAGVCQH
jgi:hypothetical protein